MVIRKKTLEVDVWWVKIWWENPIIIQSMTNTPTYDVKKTYEQIVELVKSWSELVRIAIPDEKSAQVVPEIIKKLKDNWFYVPIIWDFHFNWHILLNKFPDMAKLLSKYRINPWNVWKWDKHDDNFKQIIDCAIKNNKPVRIWINWWSLDNELFEENREKNNKLEQPKTEKEVFLDSLVESTMLSINKAIEYWLPKNKILYSIKVSDIQDLIYVNQKISKLINCPMHLWLTEAWWSTKWIVASSAWLAILLQQWIWDTIRVSITPEPWTKRSLEVEVCKYLLQTMRFRYFKPMITSCPWCWRTSSDRFQILAKKISEEVDNKLPTRKLKYVWFEKINIAVMWCIVNWIWEAEHADIWIFFPWDSEKPIIPVYLDWKLFTSFSYNEVNVLEKFFEIIESYLEKKYKK